MRPLPTPTTLSRPFWDACRDQRLVVQECSGCTQLRFIPSAFCPRCLCTDHIWVESAGFGRIMTLTVVHRPPTPAFTAPYVVAVVSLDEGFEMFTNIVGCKPEDVRIGHRVRATFEILTPEITLPFFRVVEEATG